MIDMNIILCITQFPLAKTPLQSLYQWSLTQPQQRIRFLKMESSETEIDEQPEPDSTPTEPDSTFNINEDFIIPEQLQERFVNLSKLTIDNNQ